MNRTEMQGMTDKQLTFLLKLIRKELTDIKNEADGESKDRKIDELLELIQSEIEN